MTNIEIKVLNHISELLKSIDFFNLYMFISKKLDELKIDNDSKKTILDEFATLYQKDSTKIKDCKEWVSSLLEDTTK